MKGLMMQYALTTKSIIEYGNRVFPGKEIISYYLIKPGMHTRMQISINVVSNYRKYWLSGLIFRKGMSSVRLPGIITSILNCIMPFPVQALFVIR